MRQCCAVMFTEAVNPQPVLQMLKSSFISRAFLVLLAVEVRCNAQVLDVHFFPLPLSFLLTDIFM